MDAALGTLYGAILAATISGIFMVIAEIVKGHYTLKASQDEQDDRDTKPEFIWGRKKEEEEPPPALEYDSARYHMELGDHYFERNELGLAKLEYQKSADIEPGDALIHDKLAKVSSKQGDYEAALREHAAAITLDQNQALFWLNEAVTYSRRKCYEEAAKDMQRCLSIEPKKFAYQFALRRTLNKLAHYKKMLQTE